MKKLEILVYIAVALGFIYDYANYGTMTGRSFIVPFLVISIVLIADGSAFISDIFSDKKEEPASAGTDTSPHENFNTLIISSSDVISQDFGGRKNG